MPNQEQMIQDKSTFKKINGFYFIIDSETGNKCTVNGKILRAKGVKKLSETLYLLREGYKKSLQQQD